MPVSHAVDFKRLVRVTGRRDGGIDKVDMRQFGRQRIFPSGQSERSRP